MTEYEVWLEDEDRGRAKTYRATSPIEAAEIAAADDEFFYWEVEDIEVRVCVCEKGGDTELGFNVVREWNPTFNAEER